MIEGRRDIAAVVMLRQSDKTNVRIALDFALDLCQAALDSATDFPEYTLQQRSVLQELRNAIDPITAPTQTPIRPLGV